MHPRSPSVQLLDITKTGEKPSWNLGVDTILPERAEDVVVRWMLVSRALSRKIKAKG